MGQAASAAAVLLAAGTPGKRLALPERPHPDPPARPRGRRRQASDVEIIANEVLRMRALLEELLAKHTGRDIELVRKDIERDKILTAVQARSTGSSMRSSRPGRRR